MKAANISAGVVVALWLGLFHMGRSLIYGVYGHGRGVYPNSGQIDHYMVFPMLVVVTLLLTAWVCNMLKAAQPLAIICGLAVAALLPYLFSYTGGM
jgi:hypothetical protein